MPSAYVWVSHFGEVLVQMHFDHCIDYMVWTDRFLVFGSADIVRLRGKGVQEGHAELDYQVFRGVADADLVGRQLLQNELIYSGSW